MHIYQKNETLYHPLEFGLSNLNFHLFVLLLLHVVIGLTSPRKDLKQLVSRLCSCGRVSLHRQCRGRPRREGSDLQLFAQRVAVAVTALLSAEKDVF